MLDGVKQYINDRYGSRRGLINYYKFLLQYRVGEFSYCTDIDWKKIERFIFICHGNICRSPLAEAVARERFNLRAESFGLDCTDGAQADPRAIEFAASIGLSLIGHKARHIKNYRHSPGDLIIGMEPVHLQSFDTEASPSMTLIGLWGKSRSPYIHDPYSARPNYFTRCEQAVVRGVEEIASRWSAAKQSQ